MDGDCLSSAGNVRVSRKINTKMDVAIEWLWSFAITFLNSLNDAVATILREELKKDSGGGGSGGSGLILDCIVCLNQVLAGEEYGNLQNCNHGPQFHRDCMDSWLKKNSTCPLCRSHIPRPLIQRVHAFCEECYQTIVLYIHFALDNVSKSIGDVQF